MQDLYMQSYDILMKEKRMLQTQRTHHACELGNSMEGTCHLKMINLSFLLNHSKTPKNISRGCL